jgi:hypothetical protein
MVLLLQLLLLGKSHSLAQSLRRHQVVVERLPRGPLDTGLGLLLTAHRIEALAISGLGRLRLVEWRNLAAAERPRSELLFRTLDVPLEIRVKLIVQTLLVTEEEHLGISQRFLRLGNLSVDLAIAWRDLVRQHQQRVAPDPSRR